MSWSEIEMKVIRWAEDRRIIPNGTPVSQLLKAVSEMGELADSEGKRDRAAIEDAVGDVLVCLINYCALRDLDMTRCLAGAYEQIKDRRGTLMPDGTFVKAQS
jgi:NTP pyrophosphatase (non-canonical NTP hydrolase)